MSRFIDERVKNYRDAFYLLQQLDIRNLNPFEHHPRAELEDSLNCSPVFVTEPAWFGIVSLQFYALGELLDIVALSGIVGLGFAWSFVVYYILQMAVCIGVLVGFRKVYAISTKKTLVAGAVVGIIACLGLMGLLSCFNQIGFSGMLLKAIASIVLIAMFPYTAQALRIYELRMNCNLGDEK